MSSATGSVPAGHAQPDPLRDPRVASPTERTRWALILTALTLLVPGGAQLVAQPHQRRALVRVGDGELDLEPALHLATLRPDSADLVAGVAADQGPMIRAA